MNNLLSTYRLQLHKDFTFQDLETALSYLQKLGVSTIYASPIFKAVPGSVHGYDGLDPNRINPEVGTEEELEAISVQLKKAGMSWLQDIVPNHMAFDSGNEWLMDVLEKGSQSPYASMFDASGNRASPGGVVSEGRLMVPFLGSPLEKVIAQGELRIAWENSHFVFKYFESAYPLHPLSYAAILKSTGREIPPVMKDLDSRIAGAHEEDVFGNAWDEIRRHLARLMEADAVKDFVGESLKAVNQDRELLSSIEQQQLYRLCHWQETDWRINYRRFFTINGLICLNMQEEEVFQRYHQLVEALVTKGVFQGLRIDHIDGLYDPGQYLRRLRELVGDEVPVLVEKILGEEEDLPKHWPVQGTTGYEFLAMVNNLFTARSSETAFTRFYKALIRDHRALREHVGEKKASILYDYMAGDLDNLYRLFRHLDIVDKRAFACIRAEDMREVIGEFLVHCSVYRYYGSTVPLEEGEAAGVREILDRVRYLNVGMERAVDLLQHVLLSMPHEGDAVRNQKIAAFYRRCMQFTGPLMAKGVEDTLMYTYHRFIGHNEVGDSPEAFGVSVEQFHQAMMERQKWWPLALNATSSHDTKRGEDVRARLNVLTDVEEEWLEAVKIWMRQNRELKCDAGPDANDEYFIYQTIIGAYPMAGREADDFTGRMQQYLPKAIREAKIHSNWTTPNEAYEDACRDFAAKVLDCTRCFPDEVEALLSPVIDHGIINSLSQLVLKFTCPGIPDVYQGCELWDLSLVDPDNRRPVDFEQRSKWLDELEENGSPGQLWEDRRGGKIKLWLTRVLANLRKDHAELFSKGDYIPLTVEGTYKDHVFAFARKYRQQILIIALPLHTARLAKEQGVDVRAIDWRDTSVQLPGRASAEWSNVFTEAEIISQNCLGVGDLFEVWPFALIRGQQLSTERGAGILLHVSSLPSAFGIGDVGPEARAFADVLQRSGQKYWQLLPLNPIEEGQGYSPYSSISSRAGNVLFISPELLVKEGLLKAGDLQSFYVPRENTVNFAGAEKKRTLLAKAWREYRETKEHPLAKDFAKFQEKEKEWLEEFALYAVLKGMHAGKPWYEWDDKFKLHEEEALQVVKEANEEEICKIKWLQFIFSKQWHGLKDYCNNLGIQLIGDLPIYVSYDSADVWSHRRLFALDEKGRRTGIGGTPPDAFSADGQLWGMPVFRWDVIKGEDYEWWIQRLRKNVELFDLVRLDHFRGFSAYWEVPAGEPTAKNGEWKQGPGRELFEKVQSEFGELPFVAEDLGEIDAMVYELRDSFGLAGMKVLQFAFGGDMPFSVHIPHNYSENFIVYTGTHDNNTTRGWFANEADDQIKKSIERYLGRPVEEGDVAMLLARLAYASVASIVILPLQDVLNLDERSRMNTPASGENNWSWRLCPTQITDVEVGRLREWVMLYNRE